MSSCEHDRENVGGLGVCRVSSCGLVNRRSLRFVRDDKGDMVFLCEVDRSWSEMQIPRLRFGRDDKGKGNG